MKRLLLCFVLLACRSAFGAAAGSYFGAQIDPQGWQLWLQFNTMNTNGTFALGWLTNQSLPSTPSVVLTLTSQGYNSSGSVVTKQRTIYGTHQIRFPYPSHLFPDVNSNTVANVTLIKIALSDYVFSSDSNITVTVASGIYSTNSVSSAAVTAATVTNTSTLIYPAPVLNWTWPGWNLVGSNFTVRATGDAIYGIAAVKFVVADTNGLSFTNLVTARTIDRTKPDPVPVCEYVGNMSCASMVQGSPLKMDFIAYPNIGSNVLTTFDGLNKTGPLYASQTNVCDRLGTYGYAAAVVDRVNGNNATAVVVTNFNSGSPPLPYADIGAAINAIRLTNSLKFQRTNAAGGTVYLTNGNYQFATTAVTIGTAGPAWTTIALFPGVSPANVTITNSSNRTCNHPLYFTNLFFNDAAAFMWTAEPDIWFDHCAFNQTQTTWYSAVTNGYFTFNIISNMVAGFIGQSTKCFSPCLIRGNDLSGQGPYAGLSYTVIGNVADRVSNVNNHRMTFSTTQASSAVSNADGIVIMCNKFLCYSNDGNGPFGMSTPITNGIVFEQNILENDSTNVTSQNMYFCITTNVFNAMLRYNVLAGQRSACYYDWNTGFTTQSSFHSTCFANGNIWIDFNIKNDCEPTQNGARTNNWVAVYGVGWSQNMMPEELPDTGASGSFVNEFPGMNTFCVQSGRDGNGEPTATKQAIGFTHFVNPAFASQSFVGAGSGNYRLQSISTCVLPTISAGGVWLEYDIEGNNRGGFDPPGAYASASPRKGAGFFQ